MAKFDYKNWVTENKYGNLNEQTGSGGTGSAILGRTFGVENVMGVWVQMSKIGI